MTSGNDDKRPRKTLNVFSLFVSWKLLFWWFGMPEDCYFRLTLPVPLRIVTLCSLTGFLVSEFVSCPGIATKSQSIIMQSRLVDIICENKYDLPSIYRCKTVVNWDRSEVVVSAGLSSQTALSLSASDGSWRGTLLTHVSRDCQDLAAAFLSLFSYSLLPITYYTKN